MPGRRLPSLILCASLPWSAPLLAYAQAPAPATVPVPAAHATGDAWIDRQLADIDAYARRYPDSFIDELARHLDVSRDYAQAVLKAPGWRAGDLYFACAWAQAQALACRELVRDYSAARADGWEKVLAARGEPDNASYRAVRHAIVASFDRWDRPIELDARLKQQLGDRDQRLERARAAQAGEQDAAKPQR